MAAQGGKGRREKTAFVTLAISLISRIMLEGAVPPHRRLSTPTPSLHATSSPGPRKTYHHAAPVRRYVVSARRSWMRRPTRHLIGLLIRRATVGVNPHNSPALPRPGANFLRHPRLAKSEESRNSLPFIHGSPNPTPLPPPPF